MSRPSIRRERRSDWLALGEASALLGVSAGTLRRWSDDGRIQVYTTPGGHRRFNRPALERLLPSDRPSRVSLVRSALTPARLARAYRREAGSAGEQLPWLGSLTADQRDWFRTHGRRMAELLLGHLDPTEPVDVDHALREATAEAAAYGRMAAGLGLSLGQSVEGFLQFRRPFLHELAAVSARRGLETAQTTELLERAERSLDRLLVATMAAHSVGLVGVGERPARTVRMRVPGGEDA
ncbi:MAG: helix-turn-helix domain-containing protein [Chloroflexi bacterium]|nr:helix-turn-helix domain-containing protein [Chloroflexota bacterium]